MRVLIPVPIPDKNSFIPSRNPVKNPVAFRISFITLRIAFIISGNLFTNHPISIIPKKSSILPKNPLVLLETILILVHPLFPFFSHFLFFF